MSVRPDSQEKAGRVAQRPTPILLADHPALDFLNTRAFPGGVEVEWLADGRDLVDWLEAMKLAEPGALHAAAARMTGRRLDAVAAKARSLREWLRGFVERHAGNPLARSAAGELAPLNELLGTDCAFRSIEAQPAAAPARGALLWVRHRRNLPPDATLLLPVAEAIGDLLTTEDFRLVRRCGGSGCSLVFLDRTKSHGRRWCSMAWCGNRAKAAAHRARLRLNR